MQRKSYEICVFKNTHIHKHVCNTYITIKSTYAMPWIIVQKEYTNLYTTQKTTKGSLKEMPAQRDVTS